MIYTREEIEKAKASPSFEREYNLKYLGRAGNVFHTLDIEAAICTELEGQEMMDWSTSTMVGRSMGIDVAWVVRPILPLLSPNIGTEKWKYFMPKISKSHR